MLRADITVSGVSAGGHAEHFGGFRRIRIAAMLPELPPDWFRKPSGSCPRLPPAVSHYFYAVGNARITRYLGGNTTRRGHSLAGYQLLWEALPIASREETTVKAQ
jgi:hypothetical protein